MSRRSPIRGVSSLPTWRRCALDAPTRSPLIPMRKAGKGPPPSPPKGPALPFPNSYWVVPGRLLAGEHPEGVSSADTLERLQALLDAGISCFVDLTMPEEMHAYDVDLPT